MYKDFRIAPIVLAVGAAALLQACFAYADICPLYARTLEIDCPTSEVMGCQGTKTINNRIPAQNQTECEAIRDLVDTHPGDFGTDESANEVMVQATVDEEDEVDCYDYHRCVWSFTMKKCAPGTVVLTEKANPLDTVDCP